MEAVRKTVAMVMQTNYLKKYRVRKFSTTKRNNCTEEGPSHHERCVRKWIEVHLQPTSVANNFQDQAAKYSRKVTPCPIVDASNHLEHQAETEYGKKDHVPYKCRIRYELSLWDRARLKGAVAVWNTGIERWAWNCGSHDMENDEKGKVGSEVEVKDIMEAENSIMLYIPIAEVRSYLGSIWATFRRNRWTEIA
jgi:hypothetical protein